MLHSMYYGITCLRIFCSLMSFCRSLLGLLTMISRTSCPLLGISTTKKTRSSRSLVTALTHKALTRGQLCIMQTNSQSETTVHVILYLLSFCVMVPFSSFPAIEASTLLASLAKSRSLTSAGETGTMAKASLSSFSAEVPILNQKRHVQLLIYLGNVHYFGIFSIQYSLILSENYSYNNVSNVSNEKTCSGQYSVL